jgi:hypothetical protein
VQRITNAVQAGAFLENTLHLRETRVLYLGKTGKSEQGKAGKF